MRPRQSLPRLWLMTDERIGAALWDALMRLPKGAGLVFRHYHTAPAERRALFERVRTIARRRRLVLVLADTAREATAWRADGVHGRSARRGTARPLLWTMPAHSQREMIAARRAGADFVFLSPVFATRSHPGGRVMGTARFGSIAREARRVAWRIPVCAGMTIEVRKPRVIALGGMTARRFRLLRQLGAYGRAGIDAWIDDPLGR